MFRARDKPAPTTTDTPDPTQTTVKMVGRSRVTIGRFTYGHEAMKVQHWRSGARLDIGSFCSIAGALRVMLGGNHRTEWATTFPFGHIYQEHLGGESITGHPTTKGDVRIGNDVWIGQSVTIMSGLTIGDGAVIAANSTVVKDMGPYEVWGGNPAKFLKKRFDDELIAELLALQWWDLPVETIRDIAPLLSAEPTVASIAALRAELGR